MMELREISVLVYAIIRMMKTGHSNWVKVNKYVRLTRSAKSVAYVTYGTHNNSIKLASVRKGYIQVVPYKQDLMLESEIQQLYDVLADIEDRHLNGR
jgi:hypothetical protein